MIIKSFDIADILLITPSVYEDDRGFFTNFLIKKI